MCPGPARLTGALKTKTGQKIHLDPEWLNGAMGKPERKTSKTDRCPETKTGQKIHLDPEWLNGAMGKPERK
eukprot:gene31498-6686_t